MKKTGRNLFMLFSAAGLYACSGKNGQQQAVTEPVAETHIPATPRQDFPGNGNFYFSATDSTMEKYLVMNIQNGQVEGRLYVDLYGDKWYHDFSGRFANDTSLEVTVSYKETTNDENWRLHLAGEILSVVNLYEKQDRVKFARVDAAALADTADYVQVEVFDVSDE